MEDLRSGAARTSQVKLTVVALLLVSLAGSAGLVYGTRWGIGTYPDSGKFIFVARNLLAGNGLTTFSARGALVPEVHHPPLYPVTLALVGSIGVDVVSAARWVSVFFFGATAFVVGWLIHSHLRGPFLLPAFGAWLFLTCESMLCQYSIALTEHLFFFLTTLSLLLLAHHIQGGKLRWFAGAALCASLALLTRWPGVIYLAVGVLGLLLYRPKSIRRRMLESAAFGLAGVLPAALWVLRNMSLAGTATNRPLAFHAPPWEAWIPALNEMSLWLLPRRLPEHIRIPLFLVLVVCMCVVAGWLQHQRGAQDRDTPKRGHLPALPRLMALLIIAYAAFLVVTILVFDYDVINGMDRALVPLFIPTSFLFICFVHNLLRHRSSRFLRYAVVLGCAFLACLHGGRSAKFVRHDHLIGRGYCEPHWRASPTLARVRALPPDTLIYTDDRFGIYLLADRTARRAPPTVNRLRGQVRSDWASDVLAMGAELRSRSGVLVLFDHDQSSGDPSEEQIRRHLDLSLVYREADGAIFRVNR